MKRIFLIVLDSFGIGAMPDAESFGDVGVNTLRSCAQSAYLNIPNMRAYGLYIFAGIGYKTAFSAYRPAFIKNCIFRYMVVPTYDNKRCSKLAKRTICTGLHHMGRSDA